MIRLLTVLLLLIPFSIPTQGNIINIPADYPTIQQGIDAAVDEDTVLVAPGTYIEALEILQLDITLASHFLTTDDTTFIATTVIDGDSTLQLLNCIGPESVKLIGLTFQRGVTLELGGGVWVSGGIDSQDEVDLEINNCVFREFSGTRTSVMRLFSGNLHLYRCQFEENQSEDFDLLDMWEMDEVVLQNVGFQNNHDCTGLLGAGVETELYVDSCQFIENDCNILEPSSLLNSIGSNGARIAFSNCQFLNNSGTDYWSLLSLGSDSLWVENCVFDSNTLYQPDGLAVLNLAAHHLFISQIYITNNTLFDTDGLAPGIKANAGETLVADSIFIQNNYADYDESGSGFRLCHLYCQDDVGYISNVYIENNEFRRTDLDNPYANSSDGKLGLTVSHDLIVDNLVVANNQNDATYQGLGVFIQGSSIFNYTAELKNVLIHDNSWIVTMGDYSNYASAIYSTNTNRCQKIVLDNVTVYNQFNAEGSVAWLNADTVIVRNTCFNNCGHGALITAGDDIEVSNSQLHDCYDLIYHEFFHAHPQVFLVGATESADIINCNFVDCEVYHGPTIRLYSDEEPDPIPTASILNSIAENTNSPWPSIEINEENVLNLYVRYSNIDGGWPGIGNIDADPLFVDRENDDYTLQPESPCIDAGIPDERFNDPEDPDDPGFALWPAMGTLRNDMGVYGGSGEYPPFEGVGVPDQVPTEVQLRQNYPNPFNPTTTIEFTLPHPQQIQLIVHNILGQQVALLADGVHVAGSHRVTFDGSSCPSGVYIYRLITDDEGVSRKMMLVK